MKFHKYKKASEEEKGSLKYLILQLQKVGHIARHCPMIRDKIKKGRNKIHHANAAEDEEPV